jgi:hypothetical protein
MALLLQEHVGGAFAGNLLGAPVAEGAQVEAAEQVLALAEQDRRHDVLRGTVQRAMNFDSSGQGFHAVHCFSSNPLLFGARTP